MFSTDKNIETIAELIEAVKNYIGLQTKYAKLDVIEKIVRLLTALTMLAVLLLLLFIGLIYLSFAIAYALAPLIGSVGICLRCGWLFCHALSVHDI